MSRVPGVPAEELPALADGFAAVLAALDANEPAKRPVHRMPHEDRQLVAGMRALEQDLSRGPLPIEEKVDRLRQLAIALRKPRPVLVEVAGVLRALPPAPAAPIEEQHGDAAE